MSLMLQDIRYGIRSLARRPGFTAIALLTLALGIGANTAIFSVVNAVLIRPLPFADPERIVWLWDTIRPGSPAPTSLPEFLDWKEQNRSFEYLAAFQSGNSFLDAGGGTEEVPVGIVTPEMFSLFRVNPIIGRTFSDEETLRERFRVAVLSHQLWQARFGSDPNVLGRAIQLNGRAYTIIGAVAGGGAGLLLAIRAVSWLLSLGPETIPRVHEISVDTRVAGFTLSISVATGVLRPV